MSQADRAPIGPARDALRLPVLGIVAGALVLLGAGVGGDRAGPDPWDVITELRSTLERSGPLEMSFDQTFVPAGFETGESESGRVTLGLPDCVRWDYSEPYPKSYLLCGTDLHAWNPGESIGHLYSLDETRPGLDLLLLDREALESTYRARSASSPGGLTVRLRPRDPSSRALSEVRIRMTEATDRIQKLSYRDREGNRTVFELGSPRSVDDPDRFVPPRELEWIRETP